MKTFLEVSVGDSVKTLHSDFVIGRGSAVDFQVVHKQVSSRHAEVRNQHGSWIITDLESTNGLYLATGEKVTSFSLQAGENTVWLGPLETAPFVRIVVQEVPVSAVVQEPVVKFQADPQGVLPPSTPPIEPAITRQQDFLTNLGTPTGYLEVTSGQRTVGRDPSCDITLEDPQVSRRHAVFTFSVSGCSIRDLKSANGTFVNGRRIAECALQQGDLVEIGHAQFVVNGGKLEQHVAYGLPLAAENLNVTVSGGVKILQNINFLLPAGSMTAIVGPSGSGKTTLLNALTGRRPADVGRVFLGGRDLYSERESLGRSIGFVPQDDPVHGTLSVKRALTAAARLRLPADTSKIEIKKDVESVAAELGLSKSLETKVKALSGGQRKRVSVGYELVGEPQALILDEPTSGLDPGLERELMGNLRQLADKGTTILVVTHSVQSVELCDQVLVLAPGGHLVYLGSPQNVAAHFGCAHIADVFTLLSNPPHADWAQEHVRRVPTVSVDYHQQRGNDPAVFQKGRSFFADFRVMTGRYIWSLLGEKRRLAMLFLQPPILGLILAVALGTKAFSALTIGSTGDTYYYVFSTVLIMTWFGAVSSVKEIVDERAAFRRERAVGVSSTAFVLSKWVVLCFIVFIQAMCLHLVASFRQEERIGSGALFGWGEVEYIFALSGVAIACIGLGLLISALARDASRAVTILPLVLVAVVLFSGLLLPTDGRLGIEQASYVNPVQWGGSAAASTVNLLEANNCNKGNNLEKDDTIDVLLAKYFAPKIACSKRWEPTAINQGLNFFMLLVLSMCMLSIAGFTTRWVLARPERR